MNLLLDHLWPFSEIRRLRDRCHSHWEFGEACVAYLDQVNAPNKHLRLNGKLYIMGADRTDVVERDYSAVVFRSAEGIQRYDA